MKHQEEIIAHCQFDTERMKIWHWQNELGNDDLQSKLCEELSDLLTLEVTRALPATLRLAQTGEGILEWINARNEESEVFCVRNKITHELLGLLILVDTSITPDHMSIRIGYLLHKNQWGKGLATELIKGFLDWCYRRSMKGEVLGGVELRNKASSMVLTKCGFSLLENQSNEEILVYQLIL